MEEEEYHNQLASRILSEANDLKRPLDILAHEIGYAPDELKQILEGRDGTRGYFEVISKMEQQYPIGLGALRIAKCDCLLGIKHFPLESSLASSRTLERKTSQNQLVPYYEYRDTAMSNLAPFRPEWIQPLVKVENSDPYHSDIAWNRGHFLHQLTYFVGDVNYYWMEGNTKFSREMSTGDSVYGAPFSPHSFARRGFGQGYILAMTLGAEVSRAQNELYQLQDRSQAYDLKLREGLSQQELLRTHLGNASISIENFQKICTQAAFKKDILKFLKGDIDFHLDDWKLLAQILEVDLSDLILDPNTTNAPVMFRCQDDFSWLHPNQDSPDYRIKRLAQSSRLSLVRGNSIDVMNENSKIENGFRSGLHTWLYNFGSESILFSWIFQKEMHEMALKAGDSLYVQPWIAFALKKQSSLGHVCMYKAAGAMNIAAQKELSSMVAIDRVYYETKSWY